jgi:DNA-binding response OmpR family regulator
MIKVLLVDDDRDLLEMVCMMLSTPQISPVCIDNATLVLPNLDIIDPDVIVLDIFLGSYDGRELCKKIKSSEEYRNVPVLLYSAGHILEQSLQDCNADGFLRKPFEMEELIGKIETLAKRA